MGTLQIYKARTVTGRTHTHYFSSWFLKAPPLIKKVLEIDPGFTDSSILEANRYPMLNDLYAKPDFGMYKNSALIARVSTDQGEYLHLSSPELSRRFVDISKEYYRAPAAERILAGEVGWEHAVGGKGTRMKLDVEKFSMTPRALITHARKQNEIDDTRADGYFEALKGMEQISLGVRHMLAFAYSVKALAERYGEDWRDALWNQTVFMIANKDVIDEVVRTYREWEFFGLNPEKVFFMVSEEYPVLKADAEGNISINDSISYIHNHGVARVQTTMDYSWFRQDSRREKVYLSREETREVYQRLASFQSVNIEDMDYLLKAIDINAQVLALGTRFRGLPQDFDLAEYRMMMEVVRQKTENPQKGGMLAFDPNFFEFGSGRVVVVETFELFPRYHHYDQEKAKRELYPKIVWLNRNMNSYRDPGKPGGLFELVTEEGLPLAVGRKTGGLINEMPQGAANYFLPTVYVARMRKEGSRYIATAIKNLKEPGDLTTALDYWIKQAELKGFAELLRGFKPANT